MNYNVVPVQLVVGLRHLVIWELGEEKDDFIRGLL